MTRSMRSRTHCIDANERCAHGRLGARQDRRRGTVDVLVARCRMRTRGPRARDMGARRARVLAGARTVFALLATRIPKVRELTAWALYQIEDPPPRRAARGAPARRTRSFSSSTSARSRRWEKSVGRDSPCSSRPIRVSRWRSTRWQAVMPPVRGPGRGRSPARILIGRRGA